MSDSLQTIRVIALRQPFVAFELRPWQPPMNMYETDTGAVLVVDLAGVDPAGVHIHVNPTSLVVHGARQLIAPADLQRIQRMEIGSGPFRIELALATPVDPERAEARYADGLLEVALPFAPQAPQRVVLVRIDGGAR